jgi:UDP-N-acetylmuramoyl-L-alanyl-D-glutamate--2,6-diaminopimelate ligase
VREITRGRLLLVFGCGGNRDTGKRAAMGRVASTRADFTVLTSDNPRKEDPAAILAQIREGFGAVQSHEVVEDRREAIRRALALAADGDVVLVAGKGHENFQEFANTKIPFDDRHVVRELLGTGDDSIQGIRSSREAASDAGQGSAPGGEAGDAAV